MTSPSGSGSVARNPGRPAGWRSTGSYRTFIEWAQRNGLFFALLILVAIFSIIGRNFLSVGNITIILQNVSVIGLIAIPGAMLILSGYVDLSIGSMAVFAAVVMGMAFEAGWPWPAAFVAGLTTGVAWGLLCGWLVSYLGFSAIVVTLGGLAGLKGLELVFSDAFVVHDFGDEVVFLGSGRIQGLPMPIYVFAIAFIVGAFFWYFTPLGRYMTAIGADRQAAFSLGIPVRRTVLGLFIASATCAALGGLIELAKLDASSQSIGNNMELRVLTAILLGGVSFAGGRGSLFGVLWGILFIGVLDNGLLVARVSPYMAQFAVGVALVFAAGLDVLYQRLDRAIVPEPAEEEATQGGQPEATPA
jgi:ribose/xylose/arabinose/galactoside ABC-type transport system permease subunit